MTWSGEAVCILTSDTVIHSLHVVSNLLLSQVIPIIIVIKMRLATPEIVDDHGCEKLRPDVVQDTELSPSNNEEEDRGEEAGGSNTEKIQASDDNLIHCV